MEYCFLFGVAALFGTPPATSRKKGTAGNLCWLCHGNSESAAWPYLPSAILSMPRPIYFGIEGNQGNYFQQGLEFPQSQQTSGSTQEGSAFWVSCLASCNQKPRETWGQIKNSASQNSTPKNRRGFLKACN